MCAANPITVGNNEYESERAGGFTYIGVDTVRMTNERAVSPVIGVVLMVAITVLLSAVIAQAVFSFKIAQSPPQATIEVTEYDDRTEISIRGMNNADGVAAVYPNGSVIKYTETVGGTITVPANQTGTIQAYTGEITQNESISNAKYSVVLRKIQAED